MGLEARQHIRVGPWLIRFFERFPYHIWTTHGLFLVLFLVWGVITGLIIEVWTWNFHCCSIAYWYNSYDTSAALNSPSHFHLRVEYSLTEYAVCIVYFVAARRLDFSYLCFLDSATMISIWILADLMDETIYVWFCFKLDGQGNFSNVLNTGSDGTSTFRHIMSSISFIQILRIILYVDFLYSDLVTSNILRIG